MRARPCDAGRPFALASMVPYPLLQRSYSATSSACLERNTTSER